MKVLQFNSFMPEMDSDPLDRDLSGRRPLQGTWDQAARQEVTSYSESPPASRMTDTHLWKYYPAPNFFCER